MQRVQWAVLAVLAVVLIWIGATRDTSAQMSAATQGNGRYTLNMVPVSTGTTPGYYAILLDTQTGRMWWSWSNTFGMKEFTPIHGPLEPHRPGTDQPATQPAR